MATNQPSCNHGDEDYIDMEVSSSTYFFSFSTHSPSQTREFEFQKPSICNETESTTSPADELFYNGKLLPLHFPPRFQMVQKLFQTSNAVFETPKNNLEEEHFRTLMESCNVSPSESCRVSTELNPDQFFFEWSTELRGFIRDNPKKSWSNKLKLIKQLSIGQTLKSSRAYLKSLFTKSGCSDDGRKAISKVACNLEAGNISKGNEFGSKYMKVEKKKPLGHIGKRTFPTIANIMNNMENEGAEDNVNSHRRSFSGAIKRRFPGKCSSSSSSSSSSGVGSLSSSFSFNSNGVYELEFLKRSSSADSEIEAAIAHCKKT